VSVGPVAQRLKARGRRLQGAPPPLPGEPGGRVGFAYSSKDRVSYSRRSLASLDRDGGIDLVWVDGSETAEGRVFAEETSFQAIRRVEVHTGVDGGPDAAIRFGLGRLLALGYDYCGLIENDILFEPGWLDALTGLFRRGHAEGLHVGSGTVLNYASRVLERGDGYTINWNTGAAMILFSRNAAQRVLADYHPTTAARVARYHATRLGVDLRRVWEMWHERGNRRLGADWWYAAALLEAGYASLGSVPSMARNLDLVPEEFMRSSYVAEESEPVIGAPVSRLRALGVSGSVWWRARAHRREQHRVSRAQVRAER